MGLLIYTLSFYLYFIRSTRSLRRNLTLMTTLWTTSPLFAFRHQRYGNTLEQSDRGLFSLCSLLWKWECSVVRVTFWGIKMRIRWEQYIHRFLCPRRPGPERWNLGARPTTLLIQAPFSSASPKNLSWSSVGPDGKRWNRFVPLLIFALKQIVTRHSMS